MLLERSAEGSDDLLSADEEEEECINVYPRYVQLTIG